MNLGAFPRTHTQSRNRRSEACSAAFTADRINSPSPSIPPSLFSSSGLGHESSLSHSSPFAFSSSPSKGAFFKRKRKRRSAQQLLLYSRARPPFTPPPSLDCPFRSVDCVRKGSHIGIRNTVFILVNSFFFRSQNITTSKRHRAKNAQCTVNKGAWSVYRVRYVLVNEEKDADLSVYCDDARQYN